MSVTTSAPARTTPGTQPEDPGGRRGWLSFTRGGSVRDTTPSAMLEFYSPSTALATTPAKPAARHTVLVIATMVAIIFVAFAYLPLDRIVTAEGKIVSMTPELVVQPINTAIVKTIAVAAGDVVHKGQVAGPTRSHLHCGGQHRRLGPGGPLLNRDRSAERREQGNSLPPSPAHPRPHSYRKASSPSAPPPAKPNCATTRARSTPSMRWRRRPMRTSGNTPKKPAWRAMSKRCACSSNMTRLAAASIR